MEEWIKVYISTLLTQTATPLKRKQNNRSGNKLGGVNIISLDPAYSPTGYDIDFNGNQFDGFANTKSTCFVADESWAGNETSMHNCKEGYLIDYSRRTLMFNNPLKHLVTYHTNIPETYKTIISNPFYEDILSYADITKGKSTSFKSMDLSHIFDEDKQAHGIIYTENNKPANIKYLKVIDNNASDYYTLYGNTQSNTLECRDDKQCVMYSSGGYDEVNQYEYTKDIYVSDFDEDYDKIILIDEPFAWVGEDVKVETEPWIDFGKSVGVVSVGGKQVALEGYAFSDIDGWMDVALYPENNEQAVVDNNPIIIKYK